jgi:PleD family two-component response regulator
MAKIDSNLRRREGDRNRDDKTKSATPPAGELLTQAPVDILIVDDKPKTLTVLEAILDDPGYRLVSPLLSTTFWMAMRVSSH